MEAGAEYGPSDGASDWTRRTHRELGRREVADGGPLWNRRGL